MKRIAMYVVISLMAVSVVFSNGGGESDAGTPVKISVTHPWFGGDAHAPFFDWALEDFQVQNPGIELEVIEIPQQEIRQKTRADFMAGVAADVVLWYGGAEAYDFVKEGLFLDISYIIQPMESGFINGSLENVSFEGKTYGLPLCQNFFALYLNTDIYEEYGFAPPQTYDELLTQVKEFKDGGLIPIMVPGNNHGLIQHFYSFVANMTTSRSDFDTAARNADGMSYSDAGFRKAAEIILELNEAGAFDPNVDGIPMASVEEMFARGEGAMYFAGIWRVGALPREVRDNMQPILFPVVEGYSDSPNIATSQTEMAWFVNQDVAKDSEKVAAIEAFLDYFAKPEISQAHAELTDTIVPIQTGVDLSAASRAVLGSAELVSISELRPFMRYYQSPAQGSATSEMTWNLINGRGTIDENIRILENVPPNTN